MYERDLLVAFIAFALGFLMISSAMLNYERAFELRTPQFLTDTLGRNGARFVMGFVGLIIVILGAYIACSPYFQKNERDKAPDDRLIIQESSNSILAEGR